MFPSNSVSGRRSILAFRGTVAAACILVSGAGGTSRGAEPGRTDPVAITAGTIPVLEFLKFLGDRTRVPVLFKSSDPSFRNGTIDIVQGISDADEELVKAILEVNRFRVRGESLPGGREVLIVESLPARAEARRPAGTPEPKRPPKSVPARKERSLSIAEGEIPLLDLLKALADITGLPVVHDSADQSFSKHGILFARDLPEVDEGLMLAILEVNGFLAAREALPSGREVWKVRSAPKRPENSGPRASAPVGASGERKGPGAPAAPRPQAGDAELARRLSDLEAKVGEILRLLRKPEAEPAGSSPPAPPREQ
jgi:hypothetical protein